MIDTINDHSFENNNSAVVSAAIPFSGATSATRDETVIFMTSRSIFQTLVAKTLDRGEADDSRVSTSLLLQAYFDRGGIIWICDVCRESGKWQARADQSKTPDNAPASPICGAEYVMRDIETYFRSRPQLSASPAQVGAGAGVAIIIDPLGNEIGSIAKPIKANTMIGNSNDAPPRKTSLHANHPTVPKNAHLTFGWAHGVLPNNSAPVLRQVATGAI